MPHAGEIWPLPTAASAAVALGASPASYTAPVAGALYLAGGTVTSIALVRGGVSTVLGILSGSVRLVQGDTATVTYAVIPTSANFVPG